MQPDAGGSPVAVDGRARDPQHIRYLGSRQPPEELHFDDLALAFVDARQLVQGVVQGQELGVSLDGQGVKILESDPASPVPFGGPTFPGIVHQDLAHEPGSDGDEVCPVLQLHRLAAYQPKVSLVNQGGGLQGVIRSFRLEVVMSEPAQFLVEQRQQSIKGSLVSLLPVP
jgi:hypothetical protein